MHDSEAVEKIDEKLRGDQAPLNPKFEAFPWIWAAQLPDAWQAWREGRTGIPIVDAGMRELWHNIK
jgi:deoxyribodipyrimidine photolyase